MRDIETIVKQIKPLDKEVMKKAKERQDFLTKPKESLGVLEDLSIRVAGIKGKIDAEIKEKVIITMAGDHGVTEEGVSAYPREVTPQMVYNFISGGAGINVIARHIDARVVVVDMGVAAEFRCNPLVVDKKISYGTRNIAKGPAMTRDEAAAAVRAGMEVASSEIKKKADIIGTGDMGIGNTTPSSAIVAAITGADVEKVTGRGTGINNEIFERKVEVIKKSLSINKPNPKDALDVLAKVGGFEIGGIAGVILACAASRVPVVIDGFISGAGALIAAGIAPQAKDYIIASHLSMEAGHRLALEHIGLKPLLNLNMRLGEGTGAALGISLVEASMKIMNEMATFAEAGVSESLPHGKR